MNDKLWTKIKLLLLLSTTALSISQLPVDNFKFCVLALFTTVFWGMHSWKPKKNTSFFPLSSIILALFVLFQFLSAFWAIDPSLNWIFGGIWLLFFSFSILLKIEIEENPKVQFWLFGFLGFFFSIMLIHHLAGVHFGISLNENWNAFFSQNKNYTSTLLVCLYPFLLFYKTKNRFLRFFKFIAGILVVNILILTSARGALLAMGIVVLYKAIDNVQQAKYKKLIGVTGSLLLGLGIGLFNQPSLSAEFVMVKDYWQEFPARAYLANSSIQQFLNNILFGVGTGNWPIMAYQESLISVAAFDDPNEFVRYRGHNLYTTLLAENGIIGFGLFVLAILSLLFYNLKRIAQLTPIQKAGFASLLVYLVTSYFYVTANSHEYLFSGIQFMGFLNIALLSIGLENKLQINNKYSFLFLLLSLICLIWFTYSRWVFNQYQQIGKDTTNNKEKKEIKILEKLYQPNLRTTYDYRTSLPHELATRFEAIGQIDKAESYYLEALAYAPHHEEILLDYGRFLLKIKKDSIGANEKVAQVLKIQGNNQKALLLMNKIRTLQ